MFEATHGYVLLLMLSAVVSATCAGGFLFVAPDRVPNRLVALLLGGASFWALCGVVWNVAPDPESAHFWMRLSTPGWAFVGAIVLHLVLAVIARRRPALERLTMGLYVTSAAALATGWTTDAWRRYADWVSPTSPWASWNRCWDARTPPASGSSRPCGKR